MWDLKNKTNEQTPGYREQVVAGWGGAEGDERNR